MWAGGEFVRSRLAGQARDVARFESLHTQLTGVMYSVGGRSFASSREPPFFDAVASIAGDKHALP